MKQTVEDDWVVLKILVFMMYLFIYVWLLWVSVAVRALIQLQGLLLVAVPRLLPVMACLVAGHGL